MSKNSVLYKNTGMTHEVLIRMQGLPLDQKVLLTERRIKQWYDYSNGKTSVAFSGGKDSTVLLHIARKLYPDLKAVFANTGLEYPEILSFVRTFENIEEIKPEKTFYQIIKEFGYPVVSKRVSKMIQVLQDATPESEATRNLYLTGIRRDGKKGSWKLPEKYKFLVNSGFKISNKCCYYMKKRPFDLYEKNTGRTSMLGTMAADSKMREVSYLQTGCHNYRTRRSQPIAFWTEKDIWEYIKTRDIPYCSIYDKGFERTGCIYCGFGIHMENSPNRFELLKELYPKHWNYCIKKLGLGEILKALDIPYGED